MVYSVQILILLLTYESQMGQIFIISNRTLPLIITTDLILFAKKRVIIFRRFSLLENSSMGAKTLLV